MNLAKIIRIIILLTLLVAAGWFGWRYYEDNLKVEINPDLIETSGVVEATEVRVGTEIPGPVVELLVDTGDYVESGQHVASIDSTHLDLQLQTALSQVEQARNLYQDTKKGLRPEEIRRLQQVAEAKEAAWQQTRVDYEKKEELAVSGLAPMHQAELALRAMQAARKEYESAQEQIHIARLGAREDQVQAARAAMQTAQAHVDEIRERIADSTILSPISGRVKLTNMKQGEIALAGSTIITVVNLSDPWIRTYVPEHQLGRVRLGMEVEIRSDSFEEKVYTGIIRSISPDAEFTPKNVQTKEERVKLVYAIKAYADNPDQELKPGMLVDTTIRLTPRQGADK